MQYLEFPLGILELLSACHALALVLGAPLLRLGVGARQLTQKVRLRLLLLLYLLAEAVDVGLQVAQLALELLAGLQ